MELKNNAAACMSYRRAIEVDPQDYRGWYGLGQMYDIIKMPTYSLFYYQQAHLCKLYESENQMQRAARSYEEYLREYQDIEDTDENVVYCVQFLAKHYLEQRDVDKAIFYGQKCLQHDSISEEGRLVLRTAEAMKEQHDHDNAGDMNPIKPIDDSFNSTGGFDITQGTSIAMADDSEMVISEGEGDESF
ncbi:hypothetical protein OSTOST_06671 [Ostertagia ostertagi]